MNSWNCVVLYRILARGVDCHAVCHQPTRDLNLIYFYLSLLLLVGILDVINKISKKQTTDHHPVFIGLMYRYRA